MIPELLCYHQCYSADSGRALCNFQLIYNTVQNLQQLKNCSLQFYSKKKKCLPAFSKMYSVRCTYVNISVAKTVHLTFSSSRFPFTISQTASLCTSGWAGTELQCLPACSTVTFTPSSPPISPPQLFPGLGSHASLPGTKCKVIIIKHKQELQNPKQPPSLVIIILITSIVSGHLSLLHKEKTQCKDSSLK